MVSVMLLMFTLPVMLRGGGGVLLVLSVLLVVGLVVLVGLAAHGHVGKVLAQCWFRATSEPSDSL